MILTPGEWRRLHVLTLASMGPGGSTSTSGSSPPPRPRPLPASSGPASVAGGLPSRGRTFSQIR